jgi:hypothetical protein
MWAWPPQRRPRVVPLLWASWAARSLSCPVSFITDDVDSVGPGTNIWAMLTLGLRSPWLGVAWCGLVSAILGLVLIGHE